MQQDLADAPGLSGFLLLCPSQCDLGEDHGDTGKGTRKQKCQSQMKDFREVVG